MYFDTAQHLPDLTSHETAVLKLVKEQARAERSPEADRIRQAFFEHQLKAFAKVTGAAPEACLEALIRAQSDLVLGPHFVIHVETERSSGRFTCLSVAEILDNPLRYDGCRTLDPLEPDYHDRRPVGQLLLSGRGPRLKSFAHGEADYRLESERPLILCEKGRTREATVATLAVMGRGHRFFEFGDQPCVVSSGRIVPLGREALGHYLEGEMDFGVERRQDKNTVFDPIDAPSKMVNRLLELTSQDRGLKPLDAVASMPTVRLDGSVVTSLGYDPETRIVFDFPPDSFPPVADAPSEEEARNALALLTGLLRHFRFISGRDRTAALCGLLTAVVRPVLDMAPMTVIEATDARSGKTSLARGIAALALGVEAAVTDGGAITDPVEGRKFITAFLLTDDPRVLILDNARDTQSSQALCVLMTSPYWSDRKLGQTLIKGRIPIKTMVLMTGTNLSFVKELARRTITCRLEPRPLGAKPVTDLSRTVLARRPEIVTACLTLIRAAKSAPEWSAPGELDSFPQWDRLVRQTVAWVAAHLAPTLYVDPITIVGQAVEAAVDTGEEAEILRVLHEIFGQKTFTSAEVASFIESPDNRDHGVVLRGLTGSNPRPSAKSVGRMLVPLRDRPAHGLTLRGHTSRGMMTWSIEQEPQLEGESRQERQEED